MESSKRFSHLNEEGEANMVNIAPKMETHRVAVAEANIVFKELVLKELLEQGSAKGDVFATARIAGIQAAKKCSDLIPLCHQLPLSKVSIYFDEVDARTLRVRARCEVVAKTGVEMEALTAASVSSLTIYDMCKAFDKGIVIENVKLLSKSGGKSGDWKAND